MRAIVAFLIAFAVGLGASLVETVAEEKCMIGDAALCLANPDCHWEADKRGCYPGPAKHQDACSVHGDQTICETDVTLGCKWSASENKCETKAE
jgi:hypothetical protein